MKIKTSAEKKAIRSAKLAERYKKIVEYFEQKRSEGFNVTDATYLTATNFNITPPTVYAARRYGKSEA